MAATGSKHVAMDLHPLQIRILKRLPTRYGQKAWVRILVLNPRVFLLLGACLLLSTLCVFATLRIWRSTPDEFLPEIRISLLDRLQGWALDRTARKAYAKHDLAAALFAWRAAVGQNPGNPHFHRRLLKCIGETSVPSAHGELAVRTGQWLLKLTATNHADLALTTATWNVANLHEWTVAAIRPVADDLPDDLELLYAKALFETGAIAEFAERRMHRPIKADERSELALYDLGSRAVLGSSKERTAARQEIRQFFNDEKLGPKACRIELFLCGRELDVAGSQQTLDRLVASGRDTFGDHAGHWEVLIGARQGAEARRLLEHSRHAPRTAPEALRLAAIHLKMSDAESAAALIRKFMREIASDGMSSLAAGDLLMDGRQWDTVHELALVIRNTGASSFQRAISFFFEGNAEAARHRTGQARAAFERMLSEDFDMPEVSWRVANKFSDSGFADLAVRLLSQPVNVATNNPRYCRALFKAAEKTRDADLLLKAASAAYRLDSDSYPNAFSYAGALLVTRRNPTLALSITWQLVRRVPTDQNAVINHAVALLRNGRLDEARTLLLRLDKERFDAERHQAWHLAMFELYLAEGHLPEAREARRNLNDAFMFFPERAWLKAQDAVLATR